MWGRAETLTGDQAAVVGIDQQQVITIVGGDGIAARWGEAVSHVGEAYLALGLPSFMNDTMAMRRHHHVVRRWQIGQSPQRVGLIETLW